MAYFNPQQVEVIFNETIRLLAASSSERLQLNLIDRFFDFIDGQEGVFESYIAQLTQKLPSLQNPLLFAGVKPAAMEAFLEKLRKAEASISDESIRSLLQVKIIHFQKVLGQIYRWLGEEYPASELQDALVISKDEKVSVLPGEVLIPVVEEIDSLYSGRLRKLKVEVIGRSEKNELKPAFGVIGADAGSFVKTAEAAASGLIKESIPGTTKAWNASIVFEMTHAWHAGRSANLAIAGAFYCELLKANEQQELFYLNPAACITGDVDEYGNVVSVSEKTLDLKIEAAFFSWAHVAVVPLQQLNSAIEKVAKLNQEYPNRHLPIIAVGHLRELFFDRRVSLYKKEDALRHNFKKVWKRRNTTVAVAVILGLLVVIGRLLYGPIDRNPVSGEFIGSTMFLKNEINKTVERIEVGEDFVNYENIDRYVNNYLITDVNSDKVNEVIYHSFNSYMDTGRDSVICYSISGDSVVWKRELKFDLDYSHRPDLVDNYWGITGIYDFDQEYFLVNSQYLSFFPATISKVSKRTGQIEGFIVSPGRIFHMRVEDIFDDGNKELLILSVNNSFWGGMLTVLDASSFEGHLPSGNSHKALNVETAEVIGAVRFPKTIIGKVRDNEKGTTPRLIRFLEEENIIGVEIYDQFLSGNYLSRNPGIFYRLSNRLEVEGIGSNDLWDILAREYYENGTLSFEPGIEYLSAFKDSLEWWDGQQFVNYPTLVNPYPDE